MKSIHIYIAQSAVEKDVLMMVNYMWKPDHFSQTI